jgi:hypothetical protein
MQCKFKLIKPNIVYSVTRLNLLEEYKINP